MTNDKSGLSRLEWSEPQAATPVTTEDTIAGSPDGSQTLADIARAHDSALVRYLSLITGSAEDAKEVLQEAYARILALDQPNTVSVLVKYLWRTAANLAKNSRSQRTTRSRLDAGLPPDERCAPSTESVVDSIQRVAILERAIGELPKRCRQAFFLRVIEGHRFAQVATKMGISQRVAEIHVARALEYLRHCLDRADTPRKPRG